MNTIENIKTRRSVRAYKNEPVPQDIIEKICEAGTYSPSAMNMQSAIIVAVTNPELVKKIKVMNAKIMGKDETFDPFYGATAMIIVLADKASPNYIYDGSLVMGTLMNAAHEYGLGSCWIHRAKQEFESEEGKAILKELGIEGDYEGIGHVALGYVDGEYPEAKPRKENYIYYVK